MSQQLPALAENWPADRGWQFNPIALEKNKRQYKKLIFGTWNVHTLMDRRQLTQTPEKDSAYSQRMLLR